MDKNRNTHRVHPKTSGISDQIAVANAARYEIFSREEYQREEAFASMFLSFGYPRLERMQFKTASILSRW